MFDMFGVYVLIGLFVIPTYCFICAFLTYKVINFIKKRGSK